MNTGIVAKTVVPDVSALMTRLETLQFAEPSYYLLQRAEAITDWAEGAPDPEEIAAHTQGRVFDKNGEIRWKKVGNGYSLLWLSEKDLPDGFEPFGEWQTSSAQDYLLLGGGETKPWRDTRIPRTLNYPMEWCKYPRIRVIQYKDIASQTIRFTRYTNFAGE